MKGNLLSLGLTFAAILVIVVTFNFVSDTLESRRDNARHELRSQLIGDGGFGLVDPDRDWDYRSEWEIKSDYISLTSE